MEKKSLSPQAVAALEKADQYLLIGHHEGIPRLDIDECPCCKNKSTNS